MTHHPPAARLAAPLASRAAAAGAAPSARLPRRPPPAAVVSGAPFPSAEEAWFWFVRCQVVRRDGARFAASGSLHRPCDPDDVYVAIAALRRRRLLNGRHLETLGHFGLKGKPPDPRCREEETAARLWDEALDRLTTALRDKGIVG
jgi:hypothetical protein